MNIQSSLGAAILASAAFAARAAPQPVPAKGKIDLRIHSLATEPMPPGAVKSKLSAAEVMNRIASGKIRPINKHSEPNIVRQAMLRPSVAKLSTTAVPAEARLPDGNIRHTFVDKRGRKQTVVLMGPERRLLKLTHAKQALQDPKRRAQIYQALHGFALARKRAPAPSPTTRATGPWAAPRPAACSREQAGR